jgi:hypothetical protein
MSLPLSLAVPVTSALPVTASPLSPSAGGVLGPSPQHCPGAPRPGASGRRTFYFGQPLAVRALQLVRQAPAPGAAGAVAGGVPVVEFFDPTGAVIRVPDTIRPTSWGWQVDLPSPLTAAGAVIGGPADQVATNSLVTTATGAHYSLAGVLQDALGTAGWRFAGFWRQYALFRHPVRPTTVWAIPASSGAQVHEVQHSDWGTEVVRVTTPRPATVVWSESYQDGWHAQLDSTNGEVHRSVPVHRNGLVQSADVPPGSWQVTFLYRPRGLNTGIIGSTVGVVLLVAAGVVFVVRRRRHRPAAGDR